MSMSESGALNPLATALRDHDEARLRALLRDVTVGLVTAERDGQTVPAIATGGDGIPTLLVFSGQDTFARWSEPERLWFVPAVDLPGLAVAQGVGGILFDPAGPTAAGFAPEGLRSLIEGLELGDAGEQVLREGMDVQVPVAEAAVGLRAAVAEYADATLETYVVERLVPGRAVLTVCAYGAGVAVAALAHALSTDPRVGAVDVIAISAEQREYFATDLPATRVQVGP